MDVFLSALYGGEEEQVIPQKYDWFAPLLGDWDFDYYDGYINEDYEHPSRHLKGEWIFRRILNGAGIEDLFICPSRETREENPQADGEYGVAVRMFVPQEECYHMTYTCEGRMENLIFLKEGNMLVGIVTMNPTNQWRFVEIGENTFHWQNVTILSDDHIRVNCDIYANRK